MPVYFIAEDENGDYDNLRIKIGLSKDIERRVSQLSTGSPYRLKLMGWINIAYRGGSTLLDSLRAFKILCQRFRDQEHHLTFPQNI